MKRKVLLLLFTAFLAGSVQARADEFLLGFTGFDYESPDQHPTDVGPDEYLEVNDGYLSVGFVTSFGPLLSGYVDKPSSGCPCEYTYYLYDLFVTSHTYDPGNQVLTIHFNENPPSNPPPGRDRYYEQSKSGGTPGTYGTFPPNGTSPSTFIDGTIALGGRVDQAALYYDYSSANQGGFFGFMTQDEGTYLTYIPSGQRSGWHLQGELKRPNATIPDGYDDQVKGECRLPIVTATPHQTWGAIKSMYRR